MGIIDVLQTAVGGIANGATYGLIGLGVVLLWQSVNRVNFANISSCMICVYVFFALSGRGTGNYTAAMIGGIVLTGMYGLGLRFFIYEPITRRKGGGNEFVVATLMLSVFWLCVISAVFGGNPFAMPESIADTSALVFLGPIRIPVVHVRIIVVTLFLIIFLHFFLRKTFIGKMIRATAQNREAAQLMGINVNFTTSVSFVLSTVLVGIAGILLAPIFFISLDLGGGSIGFKGFAAAVMAGLIDPYGTILGGITLGLIENFSILFVSSIFKDVISFMILIIVMIWKPRGIFNWTSKGD
jgi:branched-chain amino acid transport system permease protein